MEDPPFSWITLSAPPVLLLQKDKPSKRFWRDRRAGEEEEPAQLENGASTSGTKDEPILLDDLAARRVEDVGTVNPVQDFNSMISRTDDPNLIPKVGVLKYR
jgi:hypothetical protein